MIALAVSYDDNYMCLNWACGQNSIYNISTRITQGPASLSANIRSMTSTGLPFSCGSKQMAQATISCEYGSMARGFTNKASL